MTSTSNAVVPPQAQNKSIAELLVTEILGFSPHLLLDDYTNVSHDSVKLVIETVEASVHAWIDRQYDEQTAPLTEKQRRKRDAYLLELEQGILTLQLLVDSHSDLAFDSFETWTWRNIFRIPPDLIIVAPHHKGLDLKISDKENEEVRAEVARLRRRLEATNRLEELLTDAVVASSRKKARMEKHLKDLEFLESTGQLQSYASALKPLFDQLKTLPQAQELTLPSLNKPFIPNNRSGADGSKRPHAWEASHRGFISWGVSKAIREHQDDAESKLEGKDSQTMRERMHNAADLLGEIRSESQDDGGAFASVDRGEDVVMGDS